MTMSTNSTTNGSFLPGTLVNSPKCGGGCETSSSCGGTFVINSGEPSLDFGTFIVGGAFEDFFPNGDFGAF